LDHRHTIVFKTKSVGDANTVSLRKGL